MVLAGGSVCRAVVWAERPHLWSLLVVFAVGSDAVRMRKRRRRWIVSEPRLLEAVFLTRAEACACLLGFRTMLG